MIPNPAIKLVNAPTLLDTIFSPESKPSLRWLREQQRNRAIPSVKIGRLIFFDPRAVAAALEKRTLKPRG
jgi:hypothetical protein